MFIAVSDLPHINAALNAASTVMLTLGYVYIRRGDQQHHRQCMIVALVFSALFLVTYLIYHANSGLARFGGEGIIRPIYFTLLIVHVLAAAVVTVMVPITVSRALRQRFDRHRAIARWTWPLWMFVTISGVVVYIMAVHLYPDPFGPHA